MHLFKFKKANALTRLANFDTLPTWGDLASKIAELFDIPLEYVCQCVTHIDIGNKVRVLQYTISSYHRLATKGLEEIYSVMNHKSDIVGIDQPLAESARDSHRLTGRWAKTPIYSSHLQFEILDKQILEMALEKVNKQHNS